MRMIVKIDYWFAFSIAVLAIALINLFSDKNPKRLSEYILSIFAVVMAIVLGVNVGYSLAAYKDNSHSVSEIRESISYEAGQEAGYDAAGSATDDGWISHQSYED